MNAENIREKANEIASHFCGWHAPAAFSLIWPALAAAGVTVDLITVRRDTPDGWRAAVPWQYNGRQMPGLFVMAVHEGKTMDDYTVYFS